MRSLVAIIVIALLLQPAAGQTLLLSNERGDAGGESNVRLMVESGATAGSVTFGSGDIPAGGVGRTAAWYAEAPMAYDMVFEGDARVVLYLRNSIQVFAEIKVALEAVGDEGQTTLGRADRLMSVDGASGGRTQFAVPMSGVAPAGSHLRLSVSIEGPSGATILDFGDASSPSAVEGLSARPLDSDGDGIPDSLERAAGTDPLDRHDPGDAAFDRDRDGLFDALEAEVGTDPGVADTDGDGWLDGAELRSGRDPLDPEDFPVDADADGLPDPFERRSKTDPQRADTDADGVIDCLEDPDEDGLDHCTELAYGTDPLHADSDRDGRPDGQEVAEGTDPLRRPPSGQQAMVIELVAAGALAIITGGLAVVGLGRHRP